jgi:hypothetical protein
MVTTLLGAQNFAFNISNLPTFNTSGTLFYIRSATSFFLSVCDNTVFGNGAEYNLLTAVQRTYLTTANGLLNACTSKFAFFQSSVLAADASGVRINQYSRSTMQLIYQYQGSDNVLSIYADATESFLLNAGNQAVYLWNILGAEVNTTTTSSTSFFPSGVAILTSSRSDSSEFTRNFTPSRSMVFALHFESHI